MINIAVCDDEKEIVQTIKRLLDSITKPDSYEFCVSYFSSGIKLLDNLEDIDIVLLDIDMPEMDGIEAGMEMIRKSYRGKIIMLSGRPERFKEAFKINAFRYGKEILLSKRRYTQVKEAFHKYDAYFG